MISMPNLILLILFTTAALLLPLPTALPAVVRLLTQLVLQPTPFPYCQQLAAVDPDVLITRVFPAATRLHLLTTPHIMPELSAEQVG